MKLIDLTGKEYWLVSSEKQGPLFEEPRSIIRALVVRQCALSSQWSLSQHFDQSTRLCRVAGYCLFNFFLILRTRFIITPNACIANEACKKVIQVLSEQCRPRSDCAITQYDLASLFSTDKFEMRCNENY